MNFKELKAELRPLLFPDGEQENLVAVHDAFFNEALWDLCKMVPCYGFPHNDVYEHCATYFNCGLTVLPKPQGVITRLYTVDRIDPETGLEDPDADEDHCAKVEYFQVGYEQLKRFVDVCERCNASVPETDAILTAIFGVFRRKRRYPPPTDEGFEDQPPLPPGFHYPQADTDASGRSAGGVWAIHRGRIYIAPWIQSTESVVIEWVGLKSKWGDLDEVEDDIKFKQAVREHVAMQHEFAFGEPQRANDLRDMFYGNHNRGMPGTLPTLIHECKEQTRTRSVTGEGGSTSTGGMGSAAVGLGNQRGQFLNDLPAQYTATCPSGQTGSVTATVPAGTVPSDISIADANAKAQAKAQRDAQAALVCEDDTEGQFLSREVSATAACPGRSGNNPPALGTGVTVTLPAGRFSSTVSQQAADDAAFASALAMAQRQLAGSNNCTYQNAETSFTAECPEGDVGTNTVTIPEATSAYNSTISQQDANDKALAAAREQAQAGLVCTEADSSKKLICVNSTYTFSQFCDVLRPPGPIFDPLGVCPPGIVLSAQGTAAECVYCYENTLIYGPGNCDYERNQAQARVNAKARINWNSNWCRLCKSRYGACTDPTNTPNC